MLYKFIIAWGAGAGYLNQQPMRAERIEVNCICWSYNQERMWIVVSAGVNADTVQCA